jgi:hypothetical protein
MGAVVGRQTFSATGQYLLVEAGTGYGQGGWQIAVVGASWTGSGVLKQRTSPPGSAVALGSAITYYLVNDGSSATAAISAAANVIVQNVGSDLYFDYTHTSGTVTVTVMAAGELIGSEEGLLPVLNPAFTGTMTGPAITLTGAMTYGTKIVSTTALATPSALAATAFNAFASTVSGATLMGYGTTADVTLKSRAGNDAFLVLTNSINCSALGTLKSTGNFTVGASTFVVTAATGAVTAGAISVSAAFPQVTVTNSTAGHSGIRLVQSLNPGTTAEETAIDNYAYDSAGALQQMGSFSVVWADATAATGYSCIRLHANYNGGGASANDFQLFGNNGIRIFDGGTATGPGQGVLHVAGTITHAGAYTQTAPTAVVKAVSTDVTTFAQLQAQSSTGRAAVVGAYSDTAAGTIFGQNVAAGAFVLASTGVTNAPDKLLIGTTTASAPVYIGTNGTLAVTISGTTQAATFASTVAVTSTASIYGAIAVPATAGAAAAGTPLVLYSGLLTIEATSDAPTHTRPKGSLCINTGGSSTTTRLYVNTDGAGTWTPFTTSA